MCCSSNWRHGLVALIGATIGTVVSYYYRDVDAGSVNLGLYGFNGVLTAVAVFVVCGGQLRLAILGALVATILTPAIADIGLQTLSAPFVLTTWLMLALGWIGDNWFDVRSAPTAAAAPSSNSRACPSRRLTMSEPSTSIVLPGLVEYAKKLRQTANWQPFRPGVTAHWSIRRLPRRAVGGAASLRAWCARRRA